MLPQCMIPLKFKSKSHYMEFFSQFMEKEEQIENLKEKKYFEADF